MSRERNGISLYVNNIPYDLQQDELKDLFDRYGRVRDVYIPRDFYTRRPRGFAYVEFEHEEEAEDAIEALHRRRFHGRELVVEYAKGTRKTGQEMRARDTDEGGSYRGGYRSSRRSPSPRRRRSRSRSRSPRRRSRSRSPKRRRRSDSRSPKRRRRSDSRSPSPVRRRTRSPSPKRRSSRSNSPEYRVKDEANGRPASRSP